MIINLKSINDIYNMWCFLKLKITDIDISLCIHHTDSRDVLYLPFSLIFLSVLIKKQHCNKISSSQMSLTLLAIQWYNRHTKMTLIIRKSHLLTFPQDQHVAFTCSHKGNTDWLAKLPGLLSKFSRIIQHSFRYIGNELITS